MPVTTFTHGKDTAVKMRVSGGGGYTDISTYTNTSNLPMNREEHETTTHGSGGDKTYQGGNKDRTFELGGRWSPAVAAILDPFIAADSVDLQWGPAGAGTGAPRKSASGFVTKYEDPSDAGDILNWSMTIRVSGAVTADTWP